MSHFGQWESAPPIVGSDTPSVESSFDIIPFPTHVSKIGANRLDDRIPVTHSGEKHQLQRGGTENHQEKDSQKNRSSLSHRLAPISTLVTVPADGARSPASSLNTTRTSSPV